MQCDVLACPVTLQAGVVAVISRNRDVSGRRL
jgi:hypothetical protein